MVIPQKTLRTLNNSMNKKCNDCGGEFDKDSMFNKKSAGRCIPCYKLSRKKNYLDNKDILQEKSRLHYQNMSDEQRERSKELRNVRLQNNKESHLEYNRKWHHDNKERLKTEGKCWDTNNKERIKHLRKLRESDPLHKVKRLEYRRAYYQKNKDKIKMNDALWESIPKNKIGRRLRSRVRSALKRNVSGGRSIKTDSTQKLLGISYDELVGYLEGLFKDGMSWDNYGTWHIDHIIPCSYFDLTLEENQRICFNYQNLTPLWGEDNHSKSDLILIDNPEEFIQAIKDSLP
jgi:hypothetical protein